MEKVLKIIKKYPKLNLDEKFVKLKDYLEKIQVRTKKNPNEDSKNPCNILLKHFFLIYIKYLKFTQMTKVKFHPAQINVIQVTIKMRANLVKNKKI